MDQFQNVHYRAQSVHSISSTPVCLYFVSDIYHYRQTLPNAIKMWNLFGINETQIKSRINYLQQCNDYFQSHLYMQSRCLFSSNLKIRAQTEIPCLSVFRPHTTSWHFQETLIDSKNKKTLKITKRKEKNSNELCKTEYDFLCTQKYCHMSWEFKDV